MPFRKLLTFADLGAEAASNVVRIFKLHYEVHDGDGNAVRRQAKQRQLIDLRAQLLKRREIVEVAKPTNKKWLARPTTGAARAAASCQGKRQATLREWPRSKPWRVIL